VLNIQTNKVAFKSTLVVHFVLLSKRDTKEIILDYASKIQINYLQQLTITKRLLLHYFTRITLSPCTHDNSVVEIAAFVQKAEAAKVDNRRSRNSNNNDNFHCA